MRGQPLPWFPIARRVLFSAFLGEVLWRFCELFWIRGHLHRFSICCFFRWLLRVFCPKKEVFLIVYIRRQRTSSRKAHLGKKYHICACRWDFICYSLLFTGLYSLESRTWWKCKVSYLHTLPAQSRLELARNGLHLRFFASLCFLVWYHGAWCPCYGDIRPPRIFP